MPAIQCITYLCGCRVEINMADMPVPLDLQPDWYRGHWCPKHGQGARTDRGASFLVPYWPINDPMMPPYARIT